MRRTLFTLALAAAIASLVLSGLSRVARAQEPPEWLTAYHEPAARLIGEALSTRFAWERLAELADTYGPRLSGSTNLDAAARTLGASTLSSLGRVHLPLLVAPLGAAALLVFVDCMKELPATLLLRPFNFETLATHVYSLASIEQLEQASLAALMIVLVGLVPVLLLHEAIAGGRPGGSGR